MDTIPMPAEGRWLAAAGAFFGIGLAGLALWASPVGITAAAVGLSIWLMGRLHYVHPPGGAVALVLAKCMAGVGGDAGVERGDSAGR